MYQQLEKTRIIALSILFLAIYGCNQTPKAPNVIDETPTSGKINVAVDVSFQPVFETMKKVFESTYPKATINMIYTSESEAMNLLVKDSVRVAVVPRMLKQDELDFFKGKQITPKVTKIAIDGLAIIVHPSNADTALTMNDIKAILENKVKNWSDLKGKNKSNEKISIVVDNPGSSVVSFLLDSVIPSKKLPPNIYSTKEISKVVDYVANNKNAIGIIPVSYISDLDDATANQYLSKIQVAHIIGEDGEYRRPYQYYLRNNTYPLLREVNMISREGYAKLGTGFVAFVASDKGQKIIHKCDLQPAVGITRLIQIVEKEIPEIK